MKKKLTGLVSLTLFGVLLFNTAVSPIVYAEEEFEQTDQFEESVSLNESQEEIVDDEEIIEAEEIEEIIEEAENTLTSAKESHKGETAERTSAGGGNQVKGRGDDTASVYLTIGQGSTNWTSGFSGTFGSIKAYLDKNGKPMVNRKIEVSDEDGDDDVDATDLLIKAHKLYTDDLKVKYTTSGMGDFYTQFWGIENEGWALYYLNGWFCETGTPDLYDEDSFIIYTMDEAEMMDLDVIPAYGFDEKTYESLDEIYQYSESEEIDDSEKEEELELELGEAIEKISEEKHYINTQVEALKNASQIKIVDWQTVLVVKENGLFTDEMKAKLVDPRKDDEVDTAKNVKGIKGTDLLRVMVCFDDEDVINAFLTRDGLMNSMGMYAVDYTLMYLDEHQKYFEGETIAENLSDYAKSNSKRDDAIYYILNTKGIWGGGWWTHDTGLQNLQALVPYYDTYPEVKEKIDTCLTDYYDAMMNESFCDASCAGEYIRFAGKTGDYEKALNVYERYANMGDANWKFKGNGIDKTRMARGESGLILKYKYIKIDSEGGIIEPPKEEKPVENSKIIIDVDIFEGEVFVVK